MKEAVPIKKAIACAVLLICVLSACSVQRVPPDLIIRNVDEDKAGEITATMGTYSWDYGSGGIEADAPHPLEMQIIATIARAPQIIELVFKGKEIGYSVHRWVKDADYDDFDTVETVDNTITLPDDDESYIYEVIVEYKKGTVHYAFQVGK